MASSISESNSHNVNSHNVHNNSQGFCSIPRPQMRKRTIAEIHELLYKRNAEKDVNVEHSCNTTRRVQEVAAVPTPEKSQLPSVSTDSLISESKFLDVHLDTKQDVEWNQKARAEHDDFKLLLDRKLRKIPQSELDSDNGAMIKAAFQILASLDAAIINTIVTLYLKTKLITFTQFQSLLTAKAELRHMAKEWGNLCEKDQEKIINGAPNILRTAKNRILDTIQQSKMYQPGTQLFFGQIHSLI